MREEEGTYCDVLDDLLPNESIADEVDSPREQTGAGWALELDLVRTVIPVRVCIREGDIRDLERWHHDPVGLVIA